MALHSSVLIVGRSPHQLPDFGADFAEDFDRAFQMVQSTSFPVVIFPIQKDNEVEALRFMNYLSANSPTSQKILISESSNGMQLLNVINAGEVFRILESYTQNGFETTIQEALEEFNLRQQKADLVKLFNEQNDKLKALTVELEARVDKRQKYLNKAKKRLLSTNTKIEALHSALMAIHKAKSIGEMEKGLTEALAKALGISWARILFSSQSSMTNQLKLGSSLPLDSVTQVPLVIGTEQLGSICVGREEKASFNRDDMDFIHQVADAVSLAIDRLTKLEQAESLKHQWEATFNAISEPLCLTDDQFRIFRTNKSFSESIHKNLTNLIGKNCFEVFFGSHRKYEFKELEKKFRVRKSKSLKGEQIVYEISGQPLSFLIQENEIILILFRDITDQQKLERQILESSKMAELGTIGSSIAHELNNPVGGMITFLQLMKMDLPPEETLREDILEMEKAAIRCKEIIQNLLGFARRQDTIDEKVFDLKEAIRQSLKIAELQSRSQGIQVEVVLPEEETPVKGQPNLVSQAIRNILQNSNEALIEKLEDEPRYEGHVKVELKPEPRHYSLTITDNGSGISPEEQKKVFNPLFTTKSSGLNSGLGLTVAFKIIAEHSGKLEIYSQPGSGTSVRISLPRPDLKAVSQVFDG